MAIFTLTDAFVSVNGVTLSDHANQVPSRTLATRWTSPRSGRPPRL
jgi:hypothetical protein